MVVSFNPSVSKYKTQKTAFGSKHVAETIRNGIETALYTNLDGVKIDTEEALKRARKALKEQHDKVGKSVLSRFVEQLTRNQA